MILQLIKVYAIERKRVINIGKNDALKYDEEGVKVQLRYEGNRNIPN